MAKGDDGGAMEQGYAQWNALCRAWCRGGLFPHTQATLSGAIAGRSVITR
jgi:hypothetical protein